LNFTENDDSNLENLITSAQNGAIGIIGGSTETYRLEFYEKNGEQFESAEQVRVSHIVKHLNWQTDETAACNLMKKAQDGEFNVIIFWKLDRFCRSLLDVVNVEKKLREWGVNMCSLTENIDTTTSSGRFVFRTIASAAQWEREMISERTAMGLKALAKQHKWPNKSTPLGYKRDSNGYLKIIKNEAKLVQEIFHKYIKMKSMPQLAFLLNKRGIKTKRGKKWSAAAIQTDYQQR